MFTKKHPPISDRILFGLQHGPVPTIELISFIQREQPHITRQGVYYTLRQLAASEVVVIHKGTVSLNIAWLESLSQFCAVARHQYSRAHTASDFLQLNEGEKIQYSFKNAALTDAFWNHALVLLLEIVRPGEPWYGYDPHCWFFLARPDDERHLRDSVTRKQRQYLLTVNYHTPLDRAIVGEFDGTNAQYYMRPTPLFEQQHYYVNVLDDFIIEVWIDPVVAADIERIYQTATACTPEIISQLQAIIQKRSRSKLVISRHQKKAERFKKQLRPAFYFPKTVSTGTMI